VKEGVINDTFFFFKQLGTFSINLIILL